MECIKKRLKTDAGHIRLKGSAVVEMSYIIPLFLGLFVLIVHAVFYYHDKAVLNAAAAETAKANRGIADGTAAERIPAPAVLRSPAAAIASRSAYRGATPSRSRKSRWICVSSNSWRTASRRPPWPR